MDMIEKTNRGISGSTLKIIAIVTMFIDHVGATIVQGELFNLTYDYATMNIIFNLGLIMRIIGRLAFPIFCFLLVEGFLHTKNIKKYALRLFIFAFISEIPFDFAFYKKFFAWQHQNVFFTLFIGLVVISGINIVLKRFADKKPLCTLLAFVIAVAGMVLAEFLKCDYAALGILVIVILYMFHSKKSTSALLVSIIFVAYCINPAISTYKQLVAYDIVNTNIYAFVFYMLSTITQAFACLGFIPIHFYNGEKGLSLKYFFYAFYPAHLLLLGIIVNYIM